MQKHKALAFTGHRPESLPFGENELSASAIRIKTLLADEIMRCAAQGYDTFLAGGARGGDILFAEQVLFVKGLEYPDIRLITISIAAASTSAGMRTARPCFPGRS